MHAVPDPKLAAFRKGRRGDAPTPWGVRALLSRLDTGGAAT
jgi:hypothetical protein